MDQCTEICDEVDGRVRLLAIDRPAARNALTDATDAELGRWVVSASLGELLSTEDHRDGVASFLKERAPRYVGR